MSLFETRNPNDIRYCECISGQHEEKFMFITTQRQIDNGTAKCPKCGSFTYFLKPSMG